MDNPYFSFLMYAGDYPGLFRRSVMSLINQDYANWELLVLEDGKAAGYQNLITYMAREDERIKAFSSDETLTDSEAVGILFEQAKGDYITVLSPNDYLADSDLLGYVAESCRKNDCPDVMIPGYDIVIEGDRPGEEKDTDPTERLVGRGECSLSDILSREHIEKGICFINKEFMTGQGLSFMPPAWDIPRAVATAAMMSPKTLLTDKCIFTLDKESILIRDRHKNSAQQAHDNEKKKIYLWGKDEHLKYVASLADKRRVVIKGIVFPDETMELPESMWGYPVYGLSEMEDDYDYVLSMEGNVHDYIMSKEKTAVISECISWVSFLISPDTYFTRRRMENAIKSECEADGVITGISYAQRGLIPQNMSMNMIMAAAPSQDIYYDKNLFLHLFSKLNGGRGLKYAVVALAPYGLRYDESKSAANCSRCLAYYDMLGRTHHYELDQNWLMEMDDTRKKLDGIMTDGYEEVLASIYCDIDFKYSRRIFEFDKLSQEEEKEVMDNLHSIADKPYVDTVKDNAEYLEDYLMFLSANNVKTVVLLPAFPGIFKEVFPREIIDEETKIVEQLKERYGFAFLNLYDDPDFDDRKHFADEDHLNVYGAGLMTKKLDDCLKKL